MTEWGVVGVIIALVGLFATMVKPIITLTKTITRLTVVVERLENGQREQKDSAHTAHQKLWEHNDKQDQRLDDHELRIGILEHK